MKFLLIFVVPLKHKATNLSKVKTLRAAIDYIQYLKSLLECSDDSLFDCNIHQINFEYIGNNFF